MRTLQTFIALLLLLAGLTACSGDHTSPVAAPATKTFTAAELSQRMSRAAKLPEEALSARGAEVTAARYRTAFGEYKGLSGERIPRIPLSGDELVAVVASVVARNPGLDNPSEEDLNAISADFGGLTRAEVVQNFETIKEVYDSKLRYEVLLEVERGTPVRLATSNQPTVYGANACELWYLANFPRRTEGTYKAAQEAITTAIEYGRTRTGGANDGTRSNALRHSLWNVLIPTYTGHLFGSVEDALVWAKLYTDAHEKCLNTTNIHSSMDYHNNNQGRNFFRNYAWVDVSRWGVRSVKGPDVVFSKSQLRYRADRAVYVTNTQQMGNNPNSLVFIAYP